MFDDAMSFRAVLTELNMLNPGSIEGEDWRVVYVFRLPKKNTGCRHKKI